MPKALARGALLSMVVVASGLCSSTAAQTAASKEATATISGRIMVEEKGAAGVSVALTSSDPGSRPRVIARAMTDAEGHYLLTNVPPGRYQLMPSAPAFVVPDVSG